MDIQKTFLILMFIIFNSSIRAETNEWSDWQTYKTYKDTGGKQWVKIEYQIRDASDYSFAKWKITNLSGYTLTRVGVADKAYTIGNLTKQVKSGESRSRREPFLKTGESYTFMSDIVNSKGEKITSVKLLLEVFVIEFILSETKKTIRLSAQHFDHSSVALNCAEYDEEPNIINISVDYITDNIVKLKGDNGQVATFHINKALKKSKTEAKKIFKNKILSEINEFCGEEKTYRSWLRAVLDIIEEQIDKVEIEKQKQCKKDNPETFKSKCIMYCMGKLCRSGHKLGNGISGVRG